MGVTEGGGLSAFVGQRKCLMFYADEPMLYLSLRFSEKLHSELRRSPTLQPLAQTQFPHICSRS